MPSDPIEVACPSCSAVYTVAASDLGREGVCHDCGTPFTARRWNAACRWIVAAIVAGLVVGYAQYRADSDPYRRPQPGGFYLAVLSPSGGVFVAGR